MHRPVVKVGDNNLQHLSECVVSDNILVTTNIFMQRIEEKWCKNYLQTKIFQQYRTDPAITIKKVIIVVFIKN